MVQPSEETAKLVANRVAIAERNGFKERQRIGGRVRYLYDNEGLQPCCIIKALGGGTARVEFEDGRESTIAAWALSPLECCLREKGL